MGRFFAENAEFLRKMQFFFDFSCTVKIFALYLHSQSGNMVATFKNYCGNSSVGRAQPCQGWGREFESRFPLWKSSSYRNVTAFLLSKYVVKTAPHTPVARFCSTNRAKVKTKTWPPKRPKKGAKYYYNSTENASEKYRGKSVARDCLTI